MPENNPETWNSGAVKQSAGLFRREGFAARDEHRRAVQGLQADACRHRTVREHRALGLARRATRVEDAGGIVLVDRRFGERIGRRA